jgi:rare lipoprotein A
MTSAPTLPRVSLLLATTLTLIRVGMTVPSAAADRQVTVAEGDTLTAIALQYYGDAGVAEQIAAFNHLNDADQLVAGQVLNLPDTLPRPAAPQVITAGGTPPAGAAQATTKATIATSAPRAGPVIQTGLATWYGPGFEGQTTKCGQIFHASDLTASSNDLPCGTVIQVTDLDDGRSVVVTVDDTGGFQHPTILDLSQAAFNALASPDSGVLDVSVAPVVPSTPPS